jgi:hypothetical protein
MEMCKPTNMHLNVSTLLTKWTKPTKENVKKMDRISYKQAISNIMYTMIATRLDIATIIVVVIQFIQGLGLCNIGEKWKGSWGISQGMKDRFLQYMGTSHGTIVTSFYNSYWGGDLETWWSTTGLVVII